jgi:hypothetical protein
MLPINVYNFVSLKNENNQPKLLQFVISIISAFMLLSEISFYTFCVPTNIYIIIYI